MGSTVQNVLYPGKCALVLVDLQKLAVRGYGASNPDMVANSSRMVDACHQLSIPVIFTKLGRRADLADQFDLITDQVLAGAPKASEQKHFLEGSEDAEFVDELKPSPQDFVVVKRRQSAFYCTDLEIHLRARGVNTILVGGVATEFGVEATVRYARDRDINTVVLSDCCASKTLQAHEYPLKNIFPAMGRVMTSSKALEIMKS